MTHLLYQMQLHIFKKAYCPIALILLILCGCSSQSQQCDQPTLTSINIIDRNGLTETINNEERLEKFATVDFFQPQPYQKVLRIYTRDSQGNIPAYITCYHTNGLVKQYLEVVNSRACGTYKEWYPNGQLSISATVLEGNADLVPGTENSWTFDSCCEAWNEDGGQKALIPYNKGVLEGDSIYYHDNGEVWKCTPFVNGKIDGTEEIYYNDGQLLQEINYCNGVREGQAFRYWSSGELAAEEKYLEGYLSYGRYYDNCGVCIASIDGGNGIRAIFGKDLLSQMQEYRFGQLEGMVQVFDRYGRINNTFSVKNGCKHGEEIYYYDAVPLQQVLVPKLSINWYEGKVQGISKTWYKNGVQESQKEMSNNKKNGHHSAWYCDGSLMMIEEYEQDKLVHGEYYNRGEKWSVTTVQDGKGTVTLFDADGNFKQKIEYRGGKPVIEE